MEDEAKKSAFKPLLEVKTRAQSEESTRTRSTSRSPVGGWSEENRIRLNSTGRTRPKSASRSPVSGEELLKSSIPITAFSEISAIGIGEIYLSKLEEKALIRSGSRSPSSGENLNRSEITNTVIGEKYASKQEDEKIPSPKSLDLLSPKAFIPKSLSPNIKESERGKITSITSIISNDIYSFDEDKLTPISNIAIIEDHERISSSLSSFNANDLKGTIPQNKNYNMLQSKTSLRSITHDTKENAVEENITSEAKSSKLKKVKDELLKAVEKNRRNSTVKALQMNNMKAILSNIITIGEELSNSESYHCCAHCGEILEAECVEAMGLFYHVDHLKCEHCNGVIADEEFIFQGGKPYCLFDYTSLFGARCAGCGCGIFNEAVEHEGSKWHKKCVTCKICQKPNELLNDGLCSDCVRIANEKDEKDERDDDVLTPLTIPSIPYQGKYISTPSGSLTTPPTNWFSSIEEKEIFEKEVTGSPKPYLLKPKGSIGDNIGGYKFQKKTSSSSSTNSIRSKVQLSSRKTTETKRPSIIFTKGLGSPKFSSTPNQIMRKRLISDQNPVEMWKRKKMLESYLPDIVLNQVDLSMHIPIDSAMSREGRAAVVLADISGFTPLTERLCKERDGAEKLSEILNSYFTTMIDIIYKHGGDVVKFAGDALLVIFKKKSYESEMFIKSQFRNTNSTSAFFRLSSNSDDYFTEEDFSNYEVPQSWLVKSEHFTLHDLKVQSQADKRNCISCGTKVALKTNAYFSFHENVYVSKFIEDQIILFCHCCGKVCCSKCQRDINEMRKIRGVSNNVVSICKICFEKKDPRCIAVESSLAIIGVRCVQACLELMKELDNTQGLRLHMGVGIGEVQYMHVGGLKERWEFLLSGNALMQMSHTEPMSKSGEICVSGETWKLISNYCDGEAADADASVMKIIKMKNEIPLESSVRRWDAWEVPKDLIPLPTSRNEEESILRYIPGTIKCLLSENKMKSISELNELRCVSVLFVNLPSIDYSAVNCLALLQKSILIMQSALYQFEGSLRQFIMDDKGTTLIGVFGLYPFSHENDPLLATRCAMNMQKHLQENDISCSIGVTTGNVFSGSVGSAKRREFAVVGDIVNLSARLMVAGLKMKPDDISFAFYGKEKPLDHVRLPQPVLCDFETYNLSKSYYLFRSLTPIKVKGKVDLIPIYFPLRESFDNDITAMELVGQKSSLTIIEDLYAKVSDPKSPLRGYLCVIEGDIGLGKSRLATEFLDILQNDDNVSTFRGVANNLDVYSPFYAFRTIFAQMFSGDNINGFDFISSSNQVKCPDIKKTRLGLLLDEFYFDHIPLLKVVLPGLIVDESEATKALEGQNRGEETIRFMVRCVLTFCQVNNSNIFSSNVVMVLENLQWFDAQSMKLLFRLSEEMGSNPQIPLFIIITMRPFASMITKSNAYIRENFEELSRIHAKSLVKILIMPLNLLDIKSLVCVYLSHTGNSIVYDNLPDIVSTIIYKRSNGNPLYAIELITAMIENKLISIQNGECTVAHGLSESEVPLPDTIQGILTSRIDRLEPRCQLVIKLASVVGETLISETLLRHLVINHASPEDHLYFDKDIETLKNMHMIVIISQEPLSFAFTHSIICNVAYNMMLFSLRRKCHTTVAKFLEDQLKFMDSKTNVATSVRFAEMGAKYSQLAYHWKQAEQQSLAIEYLEKAANISETTFEYENVIVYLNRVIKYGSDIERRTKSQRRIVNAYMHLGLMKNAREQLENVLIYYDSIIQSVMNKTIFMSNAMELRLLFSRVSYMVTPATTGSHTSSSVGKIISKLENAKVLDAAKCLIIKSDLDYSFGLMNEGCESIIAAMKLTLRIQVPTIELGKCLASLASFHMILGIKISTQALSLAAEISKQLYNPVVIAIINKKAAEFQLLSGKWSEVETKSQEAIILYKTLKDMRGWECSTYILAYSQLLQGYLKNAMDLFENILNSSLARVDKQLQLWAFIGLSEINCYELESETYSFIDLSEYIREIIVHNMHDTDISSKMNGQLINHKKELLLAILNPNDLFQTIKSLLAIEFPQFFLYFGISLACEMLIQVLENLHYKSLNDKTDSSEKSNLFRFMSTRKTMLTKMQCDAILETRSIEALEELTLNCLAYFKKFSLSFPVIESIYRIYKCRFHNFYGKKSSFDNLKEWKRGRDCALKMNCKLTLANIFYEIGRISEFGSERRLKNLSRAKELYLEFNMPYMIQMCVSEMLINSENDAVNDYKKRVGSFQQKNVLFKPRKKISNHQVTEI